MVNLIQNGIDASYKASEIVISSQTGEQHIEITVVNRGKPVPSFALDRIFERFYSLPDDQGNKSSGLGLPFARQAVELHGGIPAGREPVRWTSTPLIQATYPSS